MRDFISKLQKIYEPGKYQASIGRILRVKHLEDPKIGQAQKSSRNQMIFKLPQQSSS